MFPLWTQERGTIMYERRDPNERVDSRPWHVVTVLGKPAELKDGTKRVTNSFLNFRRATAAARTYAARTGELAFAVRT